MSEPIQFPDLSTPSAKVAGEIRAEMARKRVSQIRVAKALGLNQSSISRRISGEVPFDANEDEVFAVHSGLSSSSSSPSSSWSWSSSVCVSPVLSGGVRS